MGYPVQFPHNWVPICISMPDVSAAASIWATPGFRGRLRKIVTTLNTAITGADANVTVEIGGTLVAGSAIVVTQSGSAAGDVDTATPTSANSFTDSQALEVITDGASSTTAILHVVLWCEPT
jgi:hypothetical protein